MNIFSIIAMALGTLAVIISGICTYEKYCGKTGIKFVINKKQITPLLSLITAVTIYLITYKGWQ